VHGSLARAGKVRGQTPKVAKQDKKKQPKGRAMKRIKYNRRFVTAGMRAADMLALRALRPCLRLPGGSPSSGAMHSAHAGALRQAAELTAAGCICGTRFPGVVSQVSVRQQPHAAGVLAQWLALARRRAPTPTRRKQGAMQLPAGARLGRLPLDAVHEKRSGRLSFAHILPGLLWVLKTRRAPAGGCIAPGRLRVALTQQL
jgi:small subunit ribosomal protein S30e